MRSVRVIASLQPMDKDHAQRLVFDTRLNNESRVLDGRMIFGLMDNPDRPGEAGRNIHYYPFTLDKNNDLDFGLGFDYDRFAELDLPRDTPLTVGRILTYRQSDDIAAYVITHILDA